MEKKSIDDDVERTGKVRKLIVAKHSKEIEKGIDVAGKMECPYCKGNINYGMANSVNGHIHAFCENGCVDWVE